jgi:hypothetical protein
MLDRLLRRLFRHEDESLRVLDRPEIPLNTNASEKRHPQLRDEAENLPEPSAIEAAKPVTSCSTPSRPA